MESIAQNVATITGKSEITTITPTLETVKTELAKVKEQVEKEPETSFSIWDVISVALGYAGTKFAGIPLLAGAFGLLTTLLAFLRKKIQKPKTPEQPKV